MSIGRGLGHAIYTNASPLNAGSPPPDTSSSASSERTNRSGALSASGDPNILLSAILSQFLRLRHNERVALPAVRWITQRGSAVEP